MFKDGIIVPDIPNNVTRPHNLTELNLNLTPDQSRLLKAFMMDIKGKQDPILGFLKMKYWFLRIWEAGERDGNVDKELVNQWRKKKAEILNKKER